MVKTLKLIIKGTKNSTRGMICSKYNKLARFCLDMPNYNTQYKSMFDLANNTSGAGRGVAGSP